jgi:hypothetical protein
LQFIKEYEEGPLHIEFQSFLNEHFYAIIFLAPLGSPWILLDPLGTNLKIDWFIEKSGANKYECSFKNGFNPLCFKSQMMNLEFKRSLHLESGIQLLLGRWKLHPNKGSTSFNRVVFHSTLTTIQSWLVLQQYRADAGLAYRNYEGLIKNQGIFVYPNISVYVQSYKFDIHFWAIYQLSTPTVEKLLLLNILALLRNCTVHSWYLAVFLLVESLPRKSIQYRILSTVVLMNW